jgi:hypothetical protein
VSDHDTNMAARTQIVMTMVMASLQAKGLQLSDMAPDEIQREVEEAVADLKLAEEVIGTNPSLRIFAAANRNES